MEEIYNNPLIPYEDDEVTRLIIDSVDRGIFNDIKLMTIGELRDYILSVDEKEIARIRRCV